MEEGKKAGGGEKEGGRRRREEKEKGGGSSCLSLYFQQLFLFLPKTECQRSISGSIVASSVPAEVLG